MAKTATMEEVFLDELRDLYDAEKQLTKALPKMAEASSSDQLRQAFEDHLEQTQNQVTRLEEIFENLGEKGTGKKCAAMAGLVKEGDELVAEFEEGAVRDAGLIAAAQKVEHYEIAGYGSARTHAEILGNSDAARLLLETLNEEKETDQKLNSLAEEMINDEALSASNGGGERKTSKTAKPKTKTASGSAHSHR